MNSLPQQVVVTGVGVYCPLGNTKEAVTNALREGHGAVTLISGFSTDGLSVRHAAEIRHHDPSKLGAAFSNLDWTAQFAILAARDAAVDAKLTSEQLGAPDTGLIAGVCAGGQGDSPLIRDQNDPFRVNLKQYQELSHYRQTDAVGGALKMHGPRCTVSTACASSTTALGQAFDWLQSRLVKRVIVGGMDAFSITTYAGFYALGAMAESPISPFSENIGVTFGEGAGFVVLESRDEADLRGATVYGELYGHGDTGDAHHITAPAPSGEGLARAISKAMARAGVAADDIDYVNAHGTGTRDNDTAESLAISSALGGAPNLPPVSSSKSFFGHTLGAAGILEFIGSLLSLRNGFLPPTLNHTGNRPGCDLDYIPNQAREAGTRVFLSNSAAFGGINATVVGGEVRPRAAFVATSRTEDNWDEVWITGRGVVSPIGCGVGPFHQALRGQACGIRTIDRFDTSELRCTKAGLVEKFKPRKLVPTIDARRAEVLNRYAMVAAGLAMQEASLDARVTASERLGMVMGLMYGSIAVQESFNMSLVNDGLEQLSAKYFPSMVVSTIGGQVSQSFALRGTNTTIVDGFTGGLNGLIQGYELLRQDPELDAVVVVAADEIGQVMFSVFDDLGELRADADGDGAEIYGDGTGFYLGEGGAAVVLERAKHAKTRGARAMAKLSGYGMNNDGVGVVGRDASGDWHAAAMRKAIESAGLNASDLTLAFGHGCGSADYDSRECRAFSQVFDSPIAVASLTGNLGLCGSSSGVFSSIAATLAMEHQERYPVVGAGAETDNGVVSVQRTLESAAVSNVLVAGSTENGNNAAVVLSPV